MVRFDLKMFEFKSMGQDHINPNITSAGFYETGSIPDSEEKKNHCIPYSVPFNCQNC